MLNASYGRIIEHDIVIQPANGFIVVFIASIFEALVILFVNKALRVTSATYYYMMIMLTPPIINAFLGIIFLQETIKSVQILRGIILLVSMFLAQKLEF